MKKLAALVVLFAVSSASAQTALVAPERLFNDISLAISKARVPMFPAPARNFSNPAHRNGGLPYHCENLPVVYERNGTLYKNEREIGRSPRSYEAACNGDVIWTSSYGDLYRNETKIGNASEFKISLKTGDVSWKNSHGSLYKNGSELGKVKDSAYEIATYSGQVVWLNWYGELHRDGEKFGQPSEYRMAEYTGKVAWKDSYGRLYADHTNLGNASRYDIADRTGDIVWEDGFGRLYKNAEFVTQDFTRYELRFDGRLIWFDRSGNAHSR